MGLLSTFPDDEYEYDAERFLNMSEQEIADIKRQHQQDLNTLNYLEKMLSTPVPHPTEDRPPGSV